MELDSRKNKKIRALACYKPPSKQDLSCFVSANFHCYPAFWARSYRNRMRPVFEESFTR